MIFIHSYAKAQKNTTMTTTDSTNQWIIEDLEKKWIGNKSYTIAVLNAMPEEHYDYTPSEGMMSFREQAVHIVNAFGFHLKKAGKNDLSKINANTKETTLASFNTVFNEIISYLKNLNAEELNKEQELWYGTSTLLRILNLMDNHLSHHRGQMIVYLRIKQITPPAYLGW